MLWRCTRQSNQAASNINPAPVHNTQAAPHSANTPPTNSSAHSVVVMSRTPVIRPSPISDSRRCTRYTPTEGAAVGAFGTGALALGRGHMDWPGLLGCLKDTAAVTAMIFLILLGAELYNSFLALTRMPMEAAQMIQQTALPACPKSTDPA